MTEVDLKDKTPKSNHHVKDSDSGEIENIDNQIAILKHARAVVQAQIQRSSYDESTATLRRLLAKLEREIRSLEPEPSEEETTVEPAKKSDAFALAATMAGITLLGLSIYLITMRHNQSE